MLGNLKKKLSNAIQEGIIISESLQQQYLQRSPSTPGTPTSTLRSDNIGSSSRRSSMGLSGSDLGVPADLNMAAGCNLLSKYEDDWRAIHDANDENAQRAATIAAQIEKIDQKTKAQRVGLIDLNTCLSGIPLIVDKVKASMEVLQEVTALTVTVEENLERLQDLCEECDLQEFMLQKQFEMSQYKQKKMSDLETYRQKVAAEHQAKIRNHEERLRQLHRERQAVFDNAFHEDLQEYQQTGVIPKMHKDPSKSLSLDEVVLEDNTTKDALEEFLNG